MLGYNEPLEKEILSGADAFWNSLYPFGNNNMLRKALESFQNIFIFILSFDAEINPVKWDGVVPYFR